jgi:1,4-alpha-glucan branching enzyme/maltooligosyltrehalose trehalohydrolase
VAYQGECSRYRDGKPRGEASADLPLTSFVNFLQNHDQVGNRAYGERISSLCAPEALRAATAILLLLPSPPLLFMGQEWACSRPFTYFVDFPEELGDKVNMGRLLEFARFPDLIDVEMRRKIPLPNAVETYLSAKLTWNEMNQTPHQQWFEYHRELLRIRSRLICPRIKNMAGGQACYRLLDDNALMVQWHLNDGSALMLVANLGNEPANVDSFSIGDLIFATDAAMGKNLQQGKLNPWSVIIYSGEPQL